MSAVYFYGVHAGGRAGHQTWMPGETHLPPSNAPISPWGYPLEWLPVVDSPVMRVLGWSPEQRSARTREALQVEGVWTCAHEQGWTLLAAWDRSGDNRFGSLSAFVFQDRTYQPHEAEAAARAAFPRVCARIDMHLLAVRGFAARWTEVPHGA